MAVTNLMKEQCIGIVSQAVGRQLKPAESAEMLANIKAYMVTARKADPARWQSMSYSERVEAAGRLYADSMKAEAAKIRQRAYLSVQAQADVMRSLALQRKRGYTGFSAGVQVLQEVDRKVLAAQREVESDFGVALEGKQKGILGIIEDKELSYAIVREIFEEDTGSQIAKNIAMTYGQMSDGLVERFNRSGGNMGKLDRYVPQAHDVTKMAHAAEIVSGSSRARIAATSLGRAMTKRGPKFDYQANQDAWANLMLGLVDRTKYLDNNGDQMGDAELFRVLQGMYTTLMEDGSTDFDVSTVAGRAGQGGNSRANRGDNHRSIHFKDADSFLAYHEMFGRGTIFQNMLGGMRRTAKDAALLESLGPNPNHTVRGLKRVCDAEQRKIQAQSKSMPSLVQVKRSGVSSNFFDASWGTLNGDANAITPGREMVASVSAGLRNIEVFSKLGSTFLTAVTDIPTYFITAGMNRISKGWAFHNLIHAWGSDAKHLARLGGVMGDSLAQSFQRMGSNNIGEGWTGMLANATMRLTFLDGFTNGVRRAQMNGMMGMMANLSRFAWNDIDPAYRMRLERIGVTEKDWFIWHSAVPYEHGGVSYLTKQDIRALTENDLMNRAIQEGNHNTFTKRDIDHAVTTYLAFMHDESSIASLAPDLGTRALSNVAGARGTFGGELLRNLMLFKSFPIGFMRRHFERLKDMGTKTDRATYVAKIFISMTIAGVVANQLKALAAGRDIQDLDEPETWLQGAVTGGGLGFLTDIIAAGLDGQNAYGSPNFLKFLGPVTGSMLDAWDVGKTYFNETMGDMTGGLYNRETKADAKALRFVRGHMPFVNFWYLKGVVDRSIYNELMEDASPGYLARVESWGPRHTGQEYWWALDEIVPERAPVMAESPK